jgi:hypothetical protein
MAITRAQQAKQMLQDGGMLVKPGFSGKRQGYRGEAAAASDAAAGRDAGRSDTGSASGRGDGPGSSGPSRNPMAQFDPKNFAPPPAYDEFDKPSTKNFDFMKDARKAVNPFGPLSNLPGLAGGLFRAITPNPFGFRDFTGTPPTGGSEPVPYWAQLGFSSEEEYLASLANRGSSTEEPEPEVEEPFQLARRFRAEGGIMNTDVVGGEFDFESARQMYGLGKLVKKVTKSVKKIAKSDLGKAALIAAGGYYLGGGSLFGLQRAGMSGFSFANLPGAGFFKGKSPLNTSLLSNLPSTTVDRLATKNALAAMGTSSTGGGLGIGSLITGASVLAGLLTEDQEQEAQELARGEGIDIEEARRSILNAGTAQDFRARRFAAEGGSMKEPVAKKTMPLLDMGGKEMDLRAEGGFVPIGRMEKADDVPARLSKNEFVFTADAVRNAGDGNVDKGAEVMYNMMKNLEAGGDVSEESQGLEGARKMFKTSQRLEEVL